MLGQLRGLARGPHVEAHDDGSTGLGQIDVGLGKGDGVGGMVHGVVVSRVGHEAGGTLGSRAGVGAAAGQQGRRQEGHCG